LYISDIRFSTADQIQPPRSNNNSAGIAMVKTHGLTHLALSVRDPDVSLRFYYDVFGVQEYFRDETSIHVQIPDARDVITFVRDGSTAGQEGGVMHFGFRLTDPADIDLAVQEVEKAGGRILRQGEFGPGFPFAFIHDPDGYEVEIWFE
jgi:catechol 2,3-dioxygenase-like lactoylglutathione lyase family enzyme